MTDLVWTREPPRVAGWYWWRTVYTRTGTVDYLPRCVEVELRDAHQDDDEYVKTIEQALCAVGVQIVSFSAADPKHVEWSGPIPEPREDSDAQP